MELVVYGLLAIVSLLVSYWIIRLAVRHALEDEATRVAARRGL